MRIWQFSWNEGVNYVGAWRRGAERVERAKRGWPFQLVDFYEKGVIRLKRLLHEPIKKSDQHLIVNINWEDIRVLVPLFHRIPLRHRLPLSFLILAYRRLCQQVAIGFHFCTRPCSLYFEQRLRTAYFLDYMELKSTL